ncbi:MAG TPA: pilus assembly protein TadG-related protein, partial [Anaerolineae bacterium]
MVANDDALSTSQSGQTIVLFALLLVGLLALTALAVDGGQAYGQRRIVQNASDASAIGGLRYKVRADSPTEPQLLATVHQIVEAHGVPDTDGTAGNAVNDNVLVYYTDDDGRRLIGFSGCADGQAQAPCSSIPPPMRGLEVHVTKAFPTFFAGVIGWETMQASSKAIAVVRGSLADGASDRMMTALGEGCGLNEPTFRMNNEVSEVVGDVHSNSYVGTSGDREIHYHGRVTYLDGIWTTGSGGNTRYDYPPTQVENPVSNPLEGLRVDDFKCGSGQYVIDPKVICHDVEALCTANEKTEVNMQCLKAVG